MTTPSPPCSALLAIESEPRCGLSRAVVANSTTGTLYVLVGPSFSAGIFIDSVQPAIGSIGGHTLLSITGSGFNANNASANVVTLPVQISTTFLVSGLVRECQLRQCSFSVPSERAPVLWSDVHVHLSLNISHVSHWPFLCLRCFCCSAHRSPPSSLTQNGVVLCDVVFANATLLQCLTRADLATDASATDPNALDLAPRSTTPGQVSVLACTGK